MLGRWPESYHVVDVRDRYLGIVAGQIQSREFWGFEPRKLLWKVLGITQVLCEAWS